MCRRCSFATFVEHVVRTAFLPVYVVGMHPEYQYLTKPEFIAIGTIPFLLVTGANTDDDYFVSLIETSRQPDGDKQTDRQTEKPTDKHTDLQTDPDR